MVVVMHVGILFENLDALQMKGLWTEGSGSQPECYHIYLCHFGLVSKADGFIRNV